MHQRGGRHDSVESSQGKSEETEASTYIREPAARSVLLFALGGDRQTAYQLRSIGRRCVAREPARQGKLPRPG